MYKRTVIVVDDDPTTQAVITFLLERDGFEPSTFSSTAAARAWVASVKEMPCLAVVDVKPQWRRGVDFARWLLGVSPETKVMLTTTGNASDIRGSGLSAASVEVLQKSFRAEEFRKRVDSLLLRAPERAHARTFEATRDDIGA